MATSCHCSVSQDEGNGDSAASVTRFHLLPHDLPYANEAERWAPPGNVASSQVMWGQGKMPWQCAIFGAGEFSVLGPKYLTCCARGSFDAAQIWHCKGCRELLC
eukprot:87198-Pelagomonas_calceolata.AAC.7